MRKKWKRECGEEIERYYVIGGRNGMECDRIWIQIGSAMYVRKRLRALSYRYITGWPDHYDMGE